MKVTQDKIEEAVVTYMLENGANPKYLLVDEKSYDEFSNSFNPREVVNQSLQADTEVAKFSGTSHGCTVDIIPVKTDQEMFELVR